MTPALLMSRSIFLSNRSAKERTESRSSSCRSSTSTFSMSASCSRAWSGRRAGTTTFAPRFTSARVVSIPTPESPPVTIVSFPLRSIPSDTSAAVLCAPKPDPIFCCGVVIPPR